MDIQILFTALTSFILFLILCAIVFRLTRQDAAIAWMIKIFLGIGMVTIVAYVPLWGLTECVWWASMYVLLTALFVFGIFSIMEASVTLRIFTEIARAGSVVSDKSRIIQRRIDRLLYSGEIITQKGAFMPGKTSYFGIREIVIGIFRRLFP